MLFPTISTVREGDTISRVVSLSTDLVSSVGPLVPMVTTLVKTALQLVGNVCVRCGLEMYCAQSGCICHHWS